MAFFQDWFLKLPYDDQLVITRAMHYTPTHPDKHIHDIARIVRRCVCKVKKGDEFVELKNTLIDKTIDRAFGSLLDYTALSDEQYVASYRAFVAAGEMPMAREDFDAKFDSELEKNWEAFTAEWKATASYRLQFIPFRYCMILTQALDVIAKNYGDERIVAWIKSFLELIAPNGVFFALTPQYPTTGDR